MRLPKCLVDLMKEMKCPRYHFQMARKHRLISMGDFMGFTDATPEDIVADANDKDIQNPDFPSAITVLCAIGARCNEIMESTLPKYQIKNDQIHDLEWMCSKMTGEEIKDIDRRKLQQYRLRLTHAIEKRMKGMKLPDTAETDADKKPIPVVITDE